MVRAPRHRVHNVLIVDDSPEVLEAMACLLEVHGCRVVTAESGGEVFDAFERGLRPCMMLLDIRMPDMDGWEVWDRMRAHDEWQHTPVVMLSAEPPDRRMLPLVMGTHSVPNLPAVHVWHPNIEQHHARA